MKMRLKEVHKLTQGHAAKKWLGKKKIEQKQSAPESDVKHHTDGRGTHPPWAVPSPMEEGPTDSTGLTVQSGRWLCHSLCIHL